MQYKAGMIAGNTIKHNPIPTFFYNFHAKKKQIMYDCVACMLSYLPCTDVFLAWKHPYIPLLVMRKTVRMKRGDKYSSK